MIHIHTLRLTSWSNQYFEADRDKDPLPGRHKTDKLSLFRGKLDVDHCHPHLLVL
jgi:hypothetical protein